MGSIPLLALDVKTPQQPDLLEKYGQLQQLRGLQQQQQIRAQQAPLQMQQLQQGVQQGGVQLQQQQQALKDQQASTQALGEWDGKDINNLYPLILKNGGSASAVFTLKKQALDQQHVAAETFKNQADAGKAQVETMKQKGDLINGALSPLIDPKRVPDEQLPQALQTTVQDLVSKQLLDPQHAQAAQQLVQQSGGDPAKIRAGLDQFGKTFMAQSQLLEEAHKTALEANQQAERDQAAANAKETQSYHQQEIGARKSQLSIEGARLAFDKQRQGTQDESAIEAQAQQIANGDVKGLSQARQNPFARAVMARVYEINPKYSDSLYTATQDLRSSKPNSMGGNVGRLGTAILHADEALKNSNNLGFSEGLLTGVGTSGTSAYRQSAEFLTGEIGQYVTGGKLTVDEGKKLSTDLMSSRQGVRDSALHEIITLSKGKLQSQMQSFRNATQTDFPTDRVFNDPGIKSALENHGVIGGTSPAAQVAPTTHAFSLGAWQKANPQGDPKAAAAAAQQAGYQVTQ
jgi:DNA-binding protein Fis